MDYSLSLKEWRKKRGLSQQELANIMGVHQTMISDYEKGAQVPSVQRLIQLSQILNISLDELVLYEKAHDKYNKEMQKMIEEDDIE